MLVTKDRERIMQVGRLVWLVKFIKRAAGYEGGGPPYNPIPSNRYE